MSTNSETAHQSPHPPEMLDVLDASGHPVGRVVERKRYSYQKEPLGPDDWYRVVLIGAFNADGKMLIQQRSASRRIGANLWDFTAGGAVVAGETSQQAACRELREEVGLVHDFAGQTPILTVANHPAFLDLYVFDCADDAAQTRLQVEEVQDIRWATMNDIVTMIKAGQFWAYHQSLIELVFAMHATTKNWTGTT